MYHLETTAGLLTAALKTLKPVVEPRVTIPILGAVLFDGARAMATNLDITISAGFAAIKAEGKACVSYAFLERVVRLIDKNAEIAVDVGNDGAATLSFPGGRYRLPAFDARDFPDLEMSGDVSRIGNVTDKLRDALAFTAPSISTEETRYYLNGVFFDGSEGKFGIVATDGHRLSCFPLDFDATALAGIILPRQTVNVLLKLPTPKAIIVTKDQKKVEFQLDGVTVRTKTIDGTFPDWRRIVPKRAEAKQAATFNRQALESATKRVMMASNERGRSIEFAIGEAVATVGTKNLDASGVEYIDGVDLSAPTAGGDIAFNAAYVLTALDQLKRSERVTMWMDDAGSPATFTGNAAEAKEFIILMPMRSSGDGFARQELARFSAPALKAAA
ncbi:DNA polymerase III subunit beta [Mesorhizobium sp. Cs1299R1N3]|uniref:DNA polymerase III subunit beta n=1 Tax=Mesorhizobium sp. Cs1299R1N3 TaxID=3015173 RepID=UPI00301E4A6F